MSTRSIFSSIDYISIEDLSFDTYSIHRLLECKPHLQCVKIHVQIYYTSINMVEIFPSVVKFQFNDAIPYSLRNYLSDDMQLSINLLKTMPNLYYLTVERSFISMDAHR
jgi:hypothetical protein